MNVKRYLMPAVAATMLSLPGSGFAHAASGPASSIQPFCSGSNNSITLSPGSQTTINPAHVHGQWSCGVAGYFTGVNLTYYWGDGTQTLYGCGKNCGTGGDDESHSYPHAGTYHAYVNMASSDDPHVYTSNTVTINIQ